MQYHLVAATKEGAYRVASVDAEATQYVSEGSPDHHSSSAKLEML